MQETPAFVNASAPRATVATTDNRLGSPTLRKLPRFPVKHFWSWGPVMINVWVDLAGPRCPNSETLFLTIPGSCFLNEIDILSLDNEQSL